jgi:hypothetical protein
LQRNKKADVVEHPQVFDHVGLLFDEPPGLAGLPFIESSDEFKSMIMTRTPRLARKIFPIDVT